MGIERTRPQRITHNSLHKHPFMALPPGFQKKYNVLKARIDKQHFHQLQGSTESSWMALNLSTTLILSSTLHYKVSLSETYSVEDTVSSSIPQFLVTLCSIHYATLHKQGDATLESKEPGLKIYALFSLKTSNYSGPCSKSSEKPKVLEERKDR